MRVSFIGHASLLIESGDVRMLTDPWWAGPCFGAQWWIYPGPCVEAVDDSRPNWIYLSHGHNDHFHPGTLARFRNTKILVAKELDLAAALQKMGFEVVALGDGEKAELSPGVHVTIRPTVNDDTLMVVSDKCEVCVNMNDAIHATSPEVQDRFIAWLRKEYGSVDYLFCGYGTASHFPNCYRIPNKDNVKTAALRQHYFNQSWARVVQNLEPKYAFPFAADVALLEEDLFWANEPVHNAERPVDLLNHNGTPSRTQALDIAPGFVVENGDVKQRVLRTPLSSENMRREYKTQIEKANFYSEVGSEEIKRIMPLIQENLQVCEPYLSTYPGNYSALLRLRNSAQAIEVTKQRKKVSARVIPDPGTAGSNYDLVFTTRASYLQRSLDSKYGNEILFVGSGCLFEFPTVEAVSRQVHQEVRHIVRSHTECPSSRYGASSRVMFESKQFVKRLLGRQPKELYDLMQWTVFSKD